MAMHATTRFKLRGFTVLELLAVMAICAVLSAVALPGFGRVVASVRVSLRVNSLRAGIDFARSEAVRRNTVATICRAIKVGAGEPQCSGAAHSGFARQDWASGWIVFAKGPGRFVHEVEPGDTMLWTELEPPARSTARVVLLSNLSGQYFSFKSDGSRLGGALGATFSSDFRAPQAPGGSEVLRCLVVSANGRVRSAPGREGTCR